MIEYAGMGPQREITAAIMSHKVPPQIKNVVVKNNAYTGLNVTLPTTFVNIDESTFIGNGGW